jgi:hypothetical protein
VGVERGQGDISGGVLRRLPAASSGRHIAIKPYFGMAIGLKALAAIAFLILGYSLGEAGHSTNSEKGYRWVICSLLLFTGIAALYFI